MEAPNKLISTSDLEEPQLPTHTEGAVVAAVLAAALLVYRRRLALAGPEDAPPGCGCGAQWHTVARWQQLVPTAQVPLRRQG